MAKRVRDGSKEQHWRQTLARWRSSGLSVRAYCELHRISQPSFYVWRREIPRRDGARPQFPSGARSRGSGGVQRRQQRRRGRSCQPAVNDSQSLPHIDLTSNMRRERKRAERETSPSLTNVSMEVRSTRISTVLTCPVTGAGSLLQATAWFVRVTGVPRMRKFRDEPSGISTSARIRNRSPGTSLGMAAPGAKVRLLQECSLP